MPYLYAAYMKIPGFPFTPIKVGFTTDPKRRKGDYRHGPFPIEMIGFWEGDKEDEKEFHRDYAEFRIKGEWFIPTEELMEGIQGRILLNEMMGSVTPEWIAERESMSTPRR